MSGQFCTVQKWISSVLPVNKLSIKGISKRKERVEGDCIPKIANEKGKKQKFIFRFYRVCFNGGRKCGRFGKYLEISLSCGKRWRRTLSGAVFDTGSYFWLYLADNRDCNWKKNETESADSLWQIKIKVAVSWCASMSGSSDYYAVLLCDRRMGSEIFCCLFDR